MANSKKKQPVKSPAVKPELDGPEKTGAPEGPAATDPTLVKPLAQDAFRFVMSVIDRSDFKGGEAGNVIILKNELARVAGLSQK